MLLNATLIVENEEKPRRSADIFNVQNCGEILNMINVHPCKRSEITFIFFVSIQEEASLKSL